MSKYIENHHELTEMSGGKIDETSALVIASYMAEVDGLFERIMKSQALTPTQRVSLIASIPPLIVSKMAQNPYGPQLITLSLLECTKYLSPGKTVGK
ncbi:hypothetical protein F9K50_06105 [bacterium]|nr:MAG: hypothetical protein F9K50_06105 [bacterium]